MRIVLNRTSFLRNTVFFGALAFAGSNSAFGDSIAVSFLAPGVQEPVGITSQVNNFSGPTDLPYSTTFNNSGYTGTYTGDLIWAGADQFGGAGGTGTYAETFSSYTLTMSAPVNYFGLWFSALDRNNRLNFYRGSSLVYSFTPQMFIDLVGSCPGSAYCGNPNSQFAGNDNNEQFAYLNFYDGSQRFDRIVFSQVGSGGFESDNHAVALLSAPPGGTPLNTPEPASIGIVLAGSALLFGLQRFNKARAQR